MFDDDSDQMVRDDRVIGSGESLKVAPLPKKEVMGGAQGPSLCLVE